MGRCTLHMCTFLTPFNINSKNSAVMKVISIVHHYNQQTKKLKKYTNASTRCDEKYFVTCKAMYAICIFTDVIKMVNTQRTHSRTFFSFSYCAERFIFIMIF